MLQPWDYDEIQRLLAAGELSQREIARKLGVSRGTVCAIANGHNVLERRERANAMFGGELVRCPGCGGLVYMPCLLCRVRRLKEMERGHRGQDASEFLGSSPFRAPETRLPGAER